MKFGLTTNRHAIVRSEYRLIINNWDYVGMLNSQIKSRLNWCPFFSVWHEFYLHHRRRRRSEQSLRKWLKNVPITFPTISNNMLDGLRKCDADFDIQNDFHIVWDSIISHRKKCKILQFNYDVDRSQLQFDLHDGNTHTHTLRRIEPYFRNISTHEKWQCSKFLDASLLYMRLMLFIFRKHNLEFYGMWINSNFIRYALHSSFGVYVVFF